MRTLRLFAEPPKTIPAGTSWYLADLGEARGKQELYTRQSPQKLKALRTVHPLIVLGAFNLDFLCIHPFRDGNGRVSRLLFLLHCYHLGFEVGRYISLERLIEKTKERYYETLKLNSQRWHEDKHDPWPYVNYLLYTLLDACKEFERRVGQTATPRGEKRERIQSAIQRCSGTFSVADLQRECPGVSVDTIRLALKKLKESGQVECLGRGRNALWHRIGS